MADIEITQADLVERVAKAQDRAQWEAENNFDGHCYTITKDTFDALQEALDLCRGDLAAHWLLGKLEAEREIVAYLRNSTSQDEVANLTLAMHLGEVRAAMNRCADIIEHSGKAD